MALLNTETVVTMDQLGRRVKRSVKTIMLWMVAGRKRKRDGKLCSLQFVDEGGRITTSMQAYERFIRELNE
jgi:hypothetical protein